jgi:putative type II/III system pilus formation protein
MRRAVISALLMSAFAAPAYAASVSVPMDEVRIVSFAQPVSTVFMGNAMIADVNMIDSRHVFVMGKTFGETNMIALGANGRQIADDHVTVSGRRVGAVTLNRGPVQYNFTCTKAHCETGPVPGDLKTYFDDTHGAITAHEDYGVKSAAIGAVTSNAQ